VGFWDGQCSLLLEVEVTAGFRVMCVGMWLRLLSYNSLSTRSAVPVSLHVSLVVWCWSGLFCVVLVVQLVLFLGSSTTRAVKRLAQVVYPTWSRSLLSLCG